MSTVTAACLVIISGTTADPKKGTLECGLPLTSLDAVTLTCPKGHRQRTRQDKGLLAFAGLWDES